MSYDPVIIVHPPGETGLAEALARDLVDRSFAVETHVRMAGPWRRPDHRGVTVWIDDGTSRIPDPGPVRRLVLLSVGGGLARYVPTLAPVTNISLEKPYDLVFEDVFRAAVPTLPPGTDLRVRPSLVADPVSVAWHRGELYVCDRAFGHVIRIGARDSFVVLPGLHEPGLMRIDGHRLTVHNEGEHETLTCRLVDGLATDVVAVQHHPAGSDQPAAAGLPVPLATTGDIDWCIAEHEPAVIGTGARGARLVVDGTGSGVGGMLNPTDVLALDHTLVITDRDASRLVLAEIDPATATVDRISERRHPAVQAPHAAAADGGRLAVADSVRRCVWLIDVSDLFAGASGEPPGQPQQPERPPSTLRSLVVRLRSASSAFGG